MPDSILPCLRVLILDDDDGVRHLTARMLRLKGFEVREFADAAQAVGAVAAGPATFDVVVSDAMMPGMTGSDVARHLATVAPSIPIVFISGYGQQDLRPAFGEMVPRYFLQKPFQTGDLAATIVSAAGVGERAA